MASEDRTKSRAVQVLIGTAAAAGVATAAAALESRAAAEAYLARALPEATAANPAYKDPGSDIETRWLTKTVAFRKGEDGGLVVAMHEDVLKYRGGALISQGTHDTEVPLDVTGVGLISAAWLPVESLDEAAGILFRCPKGDCIRSVDDGKPSMKAQTDITITDRETRASLYAAFKALLKGSGLP